MENDYNPNTPATAPAPPSVPSFGQVPQQPQQPQVPAPASPPSNKKVGKLIAIIGGSVGGLILLAVAIFFGLSLLSGGEAGAEAKTFINLVKDEKYDQALPLTAATADEKDATKVLMVSLHDGLGNSDYAFKDAVKKDNSIQRTYTIKGKDNAYFMLSFVKVDGRWKVEGIVVKAGSSSSSSSGGATSTDGSITSSTCLPEASLKKFWRYESGWEFYFDADTNKVQYETVSVDYITNMVDFYKANKQYNFTFVIDVSLYQGNSSSAEAQTLAARRASIVAYNMNARGIPYDNIRLGKVIYDAGDSSSDQYAAGYRSAHVSINKDCSAKSSVQNLDTKVESTFGI